MSIVDEKIYSAIKSYSQEVKKNARSMKKELGSAKNYVCTPDVKYWTFGKSVAADGEYHYNGGIAKRKLYSLGFIDVLNHQNKEFREQVIKSFKKWASTVKGYPVLEKFEKDQLNDRRFELLVHKDTFEEAQGKSVLIRSANRQHAFDEGFRKEIIHEVAKRDRKVIQLAKEKYHTICSVCKFDFSKKYGEHGKGFIEMHHLSPIALGKRKTTVDDLRPVCANCHRMLHKGNKIISIEELKIIIKKVRINHINNSLSTYFKKPAFEKILKI